MANGAISIPPTPSLSSLSTSHLCILRLTVNNTEELTNLMRPLLRIISVNTTSIPLRQTRSISKLPSQPISRANVVKAAPTIPFFGSFFSSNAGAESAETMSYPDQRSEDQWRAVLSPDQFRILRQKDTERPFTGEYDTHHPTQGVYTCAGCAAPLYTAAHKFKSGCGWPAYFDSVPGAVKRYTDSTFGIQRTEIVCSNCGGHLGHVFKGEGYPTPTDERHCVNSVSLRFTEDEGEKAKAKA